MEADRVVRYYSLGCCQCKRSFHNLFRLVKVLRTCSTYKNSDRATERRCFCCCFPFPNQTAYSTPQTNGCFRKQFFMHHASLEHVHVQRTFFRQKNQSIFQLLLTTVGQSLDWPGLHYIYSVYYMVRLNGWDLRLLSVAQFLFVTGKHNSETTWLKGVSKLIFFYCSDSCNLFREMLYGFYSSFLADPCNLHVEKKIIPKLK